jgi:hypothetical protein
MQEKYWNMISRSSHDCALSTAKAGCSGTGAMVASPNNGGFYDTGNTTTSPNNGGFYDTGNTTTSPEMRFLVNIRQAGTYYDWIRAWTDSGKDDTVHIGQLTGFGFSWNR